MGIARYCLVLMVAVISHDVYAYIYEVKTLRKWNPSEATYDYFIGMSDFHDKSHESNDVQRPIIESQLQSINKDTSKILVEDLCSANKAGHLGNASFRIASKGGILAGLGEFCHQSQIPFENVEYRYSRVITMGPVINNLHASPHLFLSTRSVKVGALIDEIDKTIAELQLKISNPALAKAFRQEAKKIRAICNRLKLHQLQHISVADYLQTVLATKNKIDVLKHLLTFDSGLLDIKLVHEAINDNKKCVVAIAGGTHIRQACGLLKKIGYEEVTTTALAYQKISQDINQCLGAHIIDGIFCIKPRPLDGQIIAQSLHAALHQ